MLKLNLSIMIVVVLMIAIVEAVFGQDTLDLTKTTDAARLNVESGRISVSTAGTRVNGASMLYWLPWPVRMGDRIDMTFEVGYGHNEGIAVGDNRIVANRSKYWLTLGEIPTVSIGATGIVKDGSVVASYSPVQSASVGIWIQSTDGRYSSALKVKSATYYEMRPTNTPTFTPSPTETETPTPEPTVEQPKDYGLTIDATPDHSWWIEDRKAGWILQFNMWRVQGGNQ